MINTASWNMLDRLIFRVENAVKNIKAEVDDAAQSEPDVEIMIAAETEHLRNENEQLKKREQPLHIIEVEEEYICPKCQERINNMGAKYCSNCGQRIIRYIASRYVNEQEQAVVETP